MKVLEKPNKKSTEIGVEDGKVYHYIDDIWFPCGDCKITDPHIKKLLKGGIVE